MLVAAPSKARAKEKAEIYEERLVDIEKKLVETIKAISELQEKIETLQTIKAEQEENEKDLTLDEINALSEPENLKIKDIKMDEEEKLILGNPDILNEEDKKRII